MTQVTEYHGFLFLVLFVCQTAVSENLDKHIQVYFQIILCFFFSNFSLHRSSWLPLVSDAHLWTEGRLANIIRSASNTQGRYSLTGTPVWLQLMTNAYKYGFGSPISRQLSSNIFICIIFKSSVILKEHITYAFIHKHQTFLNKKMYRWGKKTPTKTYRSAHGRRCFLPLQQPPF